MAAHLLPGEIVVVGFAGGGGSSEGIRQALGRDPDVALNHDAWACAMHARNHPGTRLHCQNIWRVDPRRAVTFAGADGVTRRHKVGLAWFSPDCRHFSKAKGGKPVEKRIRDLAWVVVHWARLVGPRVIMLENVEEFRDWGPLVATESGKLMPCPVQKGVTFRRWVRELRRLGYAVEWRERRACDAGAPTIRKRLYVIARRDGRPIVWPAPTHGDPASAAVRAGRLAPWRTAAECIDWSIPCPSIFWTRAEAKALGFDVRRPLADATLARIARGVWRYVVDDPAPFIVPITHTGDARVHPIDEPLRTQTCARRGEHALVAASLAHIGNGERDGQEPRAMDVRRPLGTVVQAPKHAVVAAFLAQHNTDMTGHRATEPVSTIVGKGCTQGLVSVRVDPCPPTFEGAAGSTAVAAHLLNLRGAERRGGRIDAPAPTFSAGGNHAATVAAFLTKYYGQGGTDQRADVPLHTLTAKPRHGVVTVTIAGEPYAIVDIGMRMLTPRERFNAQGFPPTWRIDVAVDGKPATGEILGRLVGNSVCPPEARALAGANLDAEAGAAMQAAGD